MELASFAASVITVMEGRSLRRLADRFIDAINDQPVSTVAVAVATTVVVGLVSTMESTSLGRELRLARAETNVATEVATQLAAPFVEEDDTALIGDEYASGTIGVGEAMTNDMLSVVSSRRQGRVTRKVLAALRAKYGVIEPTEAGRALIRRFLERNESLTKGLRYAHLADWLPRIYFMASQPTQDELVYARLSHQPVGLIQWLMRRMRPDYLSEDRAEYQMIMKP
nr:MAG: hypothetical protein [Crogonang virus 51]